MKQLLILIFSIFWIGLSAQTSFGTEGSLSKTELASLGEEMDVEAIKVFPNPAINYFEIAEDEGIHKIGVFSLIGKNVMTADHQAGKRYDVSEFRTGIYLVRLMDKDGEVIKVVRLSKR